MLPYPDENVLSSRPQKAETHVCITISPLEKLNDVNYNLLFPSFSEIYSSENKKVKENQMILHERLYLHRLAQ